MTMTVIVIVSLAIFISGFLTYSGFKFFAKELVNIKRDYQRQELGLLSPLHLDMEDALISYAKTKASFSESKDKALVNDMAKIQDKLIKLGVEADKNRTERENLSSSVVELAG